MSAYIHTQSDIYFKGLAHTVVGIGHSEICRASQNSANLVTVDVVILSPNSTGQQAKNSGRISLLQS